MNRSTPHSPSASAAGAAGAPATTPMAPLSARTATATAADAAPVPFAQLLRAEWLKLRTLRSTTISLGVLVVATLGLGVLVAALINANWGSVGAADRATFDPTNHALTGFAIGQLVIGVLGALAITGEHSTGTLRTTLLAVPDRRRAWAAKVTVFGAVAAVVGQVVAFGAFLLAQLFYRSPVPHAGLGDPGVLRAVVLSGLYLPIVGLLALGLGAIIRNTAGALAAFIGLVMVLPPLLAPLPEGIRSSVVQYLPEAIASSSLGAVVRETHSLGPWVGLAVLVGYLVVAVGLGGLLLERRDA